jgi:hypothetical protein
MFRLVHSGARACATANADRADGPLESPLAVATAPTAGSSPASVGELQPWSRTFGCVAARRRLVFRFGGTHSRELRPSRGSRRVQIGGQRADELARTRDGRAERLLREVFCPARAVGPVVHVGAGVRIRTRRSFAGFVRRGPLRWAETSEVGLRRARRWFRLLAWAERRMLRGSFGCRVGSSDRVVCCRRALRCGSGVTSRKVCRAVAPSGVTNESGNRHVWHATHSRVPVPRGPQGSRGQVRRRVSQADGCGHTLEWRLRTREADTRRLRRGSSR